MDRDGVMEGGRREPREKGRIKGLRGKGLTSPFLGEEGGDVSPRNMVNYQL